MLVGFCFYYELYSIFFSLLPGIDTKIQKYNDDDLFQVFSQHELEVEHKKNRLGSLYLYPYWTKLTFSK